MKNKKTTDFNKLLKCQIFTKLMKINWFSNFFCANVANYRHNNLQVK